MKKMKSFFSGMAFAAVAVCLSSSAAMAATACTGFVGASVLLINAASPPGCDAGTLNFSNFGVSTVGGNMLVALSGVTTSANEVDLSFQISGFSFTAPAVADLRLIYEVKGLNITGVNNLFAGSAGTTILETVCDSSGVVGGACAGKQIGQLSNGSPNVNPTSITFGAQTDIWIIKDIGIIGNPAPGTRLIVSDFTNSHETSGVPEPMTLSMMGAGLLGLSLISRRRKKS